METMSNADPAYLRTMPDENFEDNTAQFNVIANDLPQRERPQQTSDKPVFIGSFNNSDNRVQ